VFIPIGIESLLNYTRCVCLFRVDSDDCERVGKAEDITFGQAIGRNDYKEFVCD
jgi:hypothetical protein